MDPVRNPFAPGAGSPPPELAGRAGVLDDARVALLRTAAARPTQSQILVGLRGVGKTVLLVRIKEIAESEGFRTQLIEAHEGKSLAELLIPAVKSLLFGISASEMAREKARRGIRVLAGFLKSAKVSYGDVEFGLGIEVEPGAADTGNIEIDLPQLLIALGEAAAASGRSICLLIDEMQYLSEREFSALIMSVHKLNQEALPLVLVGAGLPQILGLAGESKSYSERLFRYPPIGALAESDARKAIVSPIVQEDAVITDEAIRYILEVTESYPYFLQQWGHDCWNIAGSDIIDLKDVRAATSISLRTLDQSFFKVRFDRCNPSEKRYMRALAELGPGSQRSGDIAERLGLKTTSVGPTRGKLIKKGMIYSPSHGDTAFTVPLFDAFMRRTMPLISA